MGKQSIEQSLAKLRAMNAESERFCELLEKASASLDKTLAELDKTIAQNNDNEQTDS